MTPSRITRKRTKGWRVPEGSRYIARPTVFGNPWVPGLWPSVMVPSWPEPGSGQWFFRPSLTAEEAVEAFDLWMQGDSLPIAVSPWLRTESRDVQKTVFDCFSARRTLILSRLPDLRGHDLMCWCAQGQPCHGDVLIRMANA